MSPLGTLSLTQGSAYRNGCGTLPAPAGRVPHSWVRSKTALSGRKSHPSHANGMKDRQAAATGYRLTSGASAALALVARAGIAAPPVVIGLSMGCLVTLRLASLVGSRIAGAVAIDSPVRDLSPEDNAARRRRAFGPLRVYPTRQAAMARFHPVPEQPVLAYIADHVAATSIRPVEGGWTWKFDPHIFAREQFTPELLTRLDCRVALFRAEHGIVTPQLSEVMYDRLGRVAPVVEIPAAGHHVMLDQPIALVAALRTLLSDWDHSLPGRPLEPDTRPGP